MTEKSKWPVIDPLDRRLNLYDNARASIMIRSRVERKEYLIGKAGRIDAVFADLGRQPNSASGIDTQILHGEAVEIFAEEGDYVWLQSIRDSYVGWTLKKNISFDVEAPSHWVTAPRTFIYPEPDMKQPRLAYRGMGSGLRISGETENRDTEYYLLADGSSVIKRHLAPVTQFAKDYVGVAEQLLRTPYLWGGATSFGIDCSGLVQLSMRMAGIEVLRDSDMQAATIGIEIESGDWQKLKRGDLVFWKGHVAICQGEINGVQHIIHANGYSMDVTSEPLASAIERISILYEKPIGARRPAKLASITA